MGEDLKEINTIHDLADYLGVSKELIYKWRTKGLGPKATKIGKELRFRKGEIMRWLDENTEKDAEE